MGFTRIFKQKEQPQGPNILDSLDTKGMDFKEFLEARVQSDKYLSWIFADNQIAALYKAYRAELYRQHADPLDGKIKIYYPGIGGGDQHIDPFSAFLNTDADEVLGIDLMDGPSYITNFVEICKYKIELLEDLQKTYGDELPDLQITETEFEWRADFYFNGRPRILRVIKASTNAYDFIPPEGFGELVYTSGTATMINRIPEVMQSNLVDVLEVSDDYDSLVEDVKTYWSETNKFTDYSADVFAKAMEQKYGKIQGELSHYRKRFLVRPTFLSSQ